MRIIGVTGGIGSGKSTVSRILCNIGARIIDADIVSKKVVSKGEKALDEIVAYFGPDILDPNGELDRKKLAGVVFTDSEKLAQLNSITHKYIAQEILEQIEREKAEKNYDTLVMDAALPFEYGFIDTVEEIWVITADKETRIRRVMERSGLTYEEALDRINSQMSEYEYARIADHVIENNTDIIDLEKAVVKLYFKGNVIN